MSFDWNALFAAAGAEPRAAAKTLAQRGVHLTVGRLDPGGTRLRLDVLSLGPLGIHDLEDALGVPGLAWISSAIPIDRIEAVRAAVREQRAGYYADPMVFVGEILRARPTLEHIVRTIVQTVGLGGAAVAPAGSGGVVVIVGTPVGPDAVEPLSQWARAL